MTNPQASEMFHVDMVDGKPALLIDGRLVAGVKSVRVEQAAGAGEAPTTTLTITMRGLMAVSRTGSTDG